MLSEAKSLKKKGHVRAVAVHLSQIMWFFSGEKGQCVLFRDKSRYLK